jgi:hypothetical protein
MPDTEKTELDPSKAEAFIATARERFKQCVEDEKSAREEHRLDSLFAIGEQWNEVEKKQRQENGRPCLKFARMHTFVQPISNEARQNKPAVKFVGTDDEDKELAELYEDLARCIQYESQAQVAYETALEHAATGGFGYFLNVTDYCDDESDDQELKIVPVPDPFAVYGVLKPAAFHRKPKFAFIIETYTRDEFKQEFPGSEVSSLTWEESYAKCGDWVTENEIRVACYYYIEESKEKNKSGRAYTKSTVKYCKISGLDVLPDTETEWVGSTIPIVPVLGLTKIVDGEPYFISVIRFQRDPQRLINLYKSRIAETLQTAPIQPFVAVEDSLIRPEDWAMSNRKNFNVLYYKSKVNGVEVKPPQRQVFEPPIGSLSEAARQEIDDMKDTTGIFDASRGARSQMRLPEWLFRGVNSSPTSRICTSWTTLGVHST